MRRTTTLTALACLAGLSLGAGATAPAQAAETCDGKVATIVVAPSPSPSVQHTASVTGTPGDDVIVGTEGNDTVDGGGGNDVICGLGGADTLVGGDGDDRLFGGADAVYDYEAVYGDLLVPGAGDDHVDLGTGAERISFWESDPQVDQVSYANSPVGVQVDLTTGTASGHGTDTIVTGTTGRPVGVIGSSHDDTLLGTVGRDVVSGGAGNDTIVTGDGADRVSPDAPGRTTSGIYIDLGGAERESQPGDDTVSTGAGSDLVWVRRGTDVVRGGAEDDRLNSSSPERGTRLLGGEGKDRLNGEGPSILLGQSGNDQLGGAIVAGSSTTWNGGAGRDSLALTVPRRDSLDLLRIDVPARRVLGDGARVGSLRGIERFGIYAKIGQAVFVGGPAAERFTSTAKRVRAFGNAGNDQLVGTRKADLLDGGPGRDDLNGSAGRDRCLRGERLISCEVRR